MTEQNSTIAAVRAGSVSQVEPEFLEIPDATRFSGIGRTSLYGLIKDGKIKSVSLRRPGTARGKRLIHLASLRGYIRSFEKEA